MSKFQDKSKPPGHGELEMLLKLKLEKMIRKSCWAIPNISNAAENREEMFQFLDNFENEFAAHKEILEGDARLYNIFLAQLRAKLPPQISERVAVQSPANFQDTICQILRATKFVRPRKVIEIIARSAVQKEKEAPMEFVHRLRTLMREFRFALKRERVYDKNEELNFEKTIFDQAVACTTCPNARMLIRSSNVHSLNELIEILEENF